MATSKSKKEYTCEACGLCEGDITSPKMEAYGRGLLRIMIIGEAPTAVDDRKDMPWQGISGRMLEHALKKHDIDLFEDCVSINAVNCRPTNNRTPKAFEIECCREMMVSAAIKFHRPKVIILMGGAAVQSFLAPRWPTDLRGIDRWRGFRIPDKDFNAWVIPTLHPSYVGYIDSKEAMTVWHQDLALAAEVALEDVEVPRYFEPKIHMIEDLEELDKHRDAPEMAIDYETTGLKSQGKGHRIVCAAACFNEMEVYAFMMPGSRVERKPFMNMLTDPEMGKFAHNLKFEHAWTLNRYGVEVQNWQWDSMLAAHQLDNRAGITSLKFQVYVNFGIIIKDADVSEYIYNRNGNGNSFNRIFELVETQEGVEKLLRHVALDAFWEFRLAKKQMKELNYQGLPF